MTSKCDLSGRVAIVTGGGGGIGRGIALSLAQAGADVVIADIIAERAEEAAERVRELGRKAMACAIDVMDTSAIQAMVTKADERFGRLDILVNNAGGVSPRAFLDQSENSWRRHMDINMTSMFAATSAAAPIIIRGARGGSIINITSLEGTRAAPGYAVYAACKAGMISFTRSMALELSKHQIRVNAISPDHTVTPGNNGNRSGPVDQALWRVKSDAEIDAMNRLIPLGREGVAEECGDAAVFLASQMSSYITGVVLPVDGGTWASGGWIRGRSGHFTQNEGLNFAGID